MNASSERNLLLGILALQLDFVNREQLLTAFQAWVGDKARGLHEILTDSGALNKDSGELLVALVEQHLKMHGGDAKKSLATVFPIGPLRDELETIGDRQIDATLSIVAADRDTVASYSSSSAGPSDSLGQRFRFVRRHAKGGLGEVSVARDTEVNREVALKEIQARFADDPNSRARFLLEAEVTGGLEHPGIVPVYGLGQYADGRPYYAMRFIRGESLQDAVDQFHAAAGRSKSESGLELRQLLGRLIDVCQAIEYAHSRGVLHRDLKPGNIMLGKYGETLVVDWGLAKAQGRQESQDETGEQTLQPSAASGSAHTQQGSVIGTPAYMSPEQAAGRLDDLAGASDVYSLGATLYYVLTGKAPFGGADLAATLRKVQSGDFPKPSELNAATPKPLEAIAAKAMALRPEDRYKSPGALAEDIERFLADEPIAANPEPLAVCARRWLRKHPKTVAALGATTLVGLASATLIATVVLSANENLRVANVQERAAKMDAEASRRDAIQSLVTALQFAPPERVPNSLESLRPFREQALPMCRHQFEQSDGVSKLQTALALAAFGEPPHDYLIQQLPDAVERQAENLLASLEVDPAESLKRLDVAFRGLSDKARPQRARVALVALRFGNHELAASMLKSAPDPSQRACLIDLFRVWKGDLSQLPPLLASSDDEDFRSGICLALGGCPKEDIEPQVRRQFVELFKSWFTFSGDPGAHSAAGWTLRRWGEDLPLESVAKAPSPKDDVDDDRPWRVNSLGLTMIRIRPGKFVRSDGGKAADVKGASRIALDAPQTVTLTRPFLLSDTEICLNHYRPFVEETGFVQAPRAGDSKNTGDRPPSQVAPSEVAPSQVAPPQHPQGDPSSNIATGGLSGIPRVRSGIDTRLPVQDVTWVEAAAFCNWLSQREGLPQVYARNADGSLRQDRAALGYRLPTEAEWEFACRAGARTVYVCGDDTAYLDQYAAYRTDFLQTAGAFMPNRWGLFDMHGNVAEWCQDFHGSFQAASAWHPVDPVGPESGTYKIVRGGTFRDSPGLLCAGSRQRAAPTDRRPDLGFRVARYAN